MSGIKKHGMIYSSEYRIWQGLKNRCLNSKGRDYRYYGGRGITVCDEWRDSFLNFYEDMGERPEGTSLDRIDVNGDYTPDNCRWANNIIQARNKRTPVNNKSGFKGVRRHKASNKWISTIGHNGKEIYLGYFDKLEDAVKARKEAEKKFWK